MKNVSNFLIILSIFTSACNASLPYHHDLQSLRILQTTDHLNADSYSLSFSPSIVKDGELITIYYNFTSPSTGDWIGLFSPSISYFNITNRTPVKWIPLWITVDGYTNSSGLGSVQMQIIDVRANFSICAFSSGWQSAKLRSCAPSVLSVIDAGAARRARILPASSTGDAINVVWTVGDDYLLRIKQQFAPLSIAPALFYGTESTLSSGLGGGGSRQLVRAKSDTIISRESLCSAPANAEGFSDLGHTLTATILNVQSLVSSSSSSRRIYYQYGFAFENGTGVYLSKEKFFRVPPPPGLTFPTRMIMFGDFGRSSIDYFTNGVSTWSKYGPPEYTTPAYNSSQLILSEITSNEANVDALHIFGDVSYASGYLSVWDIYLHMIEPWSERLLSFSSLGNHESGILTGQTALKSQDSGGECGIVTTSLFPLPPLTASSPLISTNLPFYSYSVGPIFVLVLATETDFSINSPQWVFIKTTLQNIDRRITPFIVVSAHRPMYIDSTYSGNPTADAEVSQALRDSVEPLLIQYKVTLSVYGHNHAVQRISAVYKNAIVQASTLHKLSDGNMSHLFFRPQATVHAVWGTAGAGFTMNANPTSSKPAWSEEVYYEWGYARVIAINSSALYYEWVSNSNNQVMDRVLILQDIEQPWVDTLVNGGSSNAIDWNTIGIGIGVGSSSIVMLIAGYCLRIRQQRSNELSALRSRRGGYEIVQVVK
jgi:hypothetical protein